MSTRVTKKRSENQDIIAAGDILADQLIAKWPRAAMLVDDLVPLCSGYYAIFVDDSASLGLEFGELLRCRKTHLIYVGIAQKTVLRKRLVEQDLRGKSNSTFFRGLGAVLGYRPPAGSSKRPKNYKFNSSDRDYIIEWINKHLFVSWKKDPKANTDLEHAVIKRLKPLLNTRGNPDPCTRLADLRKKCMCIAKQSST